MERHGFDADRRRELAMKLIRKSAALPSLEICKGWRNSNWIGPRVPEIEDWIKHAAIPGGAGFVPPEKS